MSNRARPRGASRGRRHAPAAGPPALTALLAVLAAALLLAAPAAHADMAFVPGRAVAETRKADGRAETQAAAAPFVARTVFELANATTSPRSGWYVTMPDENVRDIVVDLPAGLVGDPQATPRCPRRVLARAAAVALPCPDSTQVGTIYLDFGMSTGASTVAGSVVPHQYPVYNMVPRKGDLADFTFVVFGFGGTHVIASVRAGDYGVRTNISSISTVFPLIRSTMELWGVPADPAHDPDRGKLCLQGICLGPGGRSSAAAPRAFLRNPAVCDGSEPVTHMTADSWQSPGRLGRTSARSPPVTGCDRLTFTPAIDVKPTTSLPDKPTGLDVSIDLPQNDDPYGLGSPPLKQATVTLPEGMTVNPASASGLQACADGQLNIGNTRPVSCPDAAKIGSVEATSPVLDGPLTGGIYLRPQASADPESGELFRIALVLEHEERGLSIRLPGSIRADKDTGRLVTTFDDNPQLPVSNVTLRFMSGPRAPLATPTTCGEKTVHATLTSWAGQSADITSSFSIDCVPGLGGFAPAFSAGTLSPVAGADSPFTVQIGKADGQSALTGVELRLPKGLLATLKGNVGTQVGTAKVAAGPGGSPYWLSGPVVLEGPYGGAPFSLRVTVPAIAGPFDLGTVVVRQRLYVDPATTQVTVVSDPLPTIVSGVPVRLQRLVVDMDKQGFMFNPTNCSETSVTGRLGSAAGQGADVASRFQVGECASLPFKPRMSLRVGDARHTRANKTTPLLVTLRMPSGSANNRRVAVTLPKTMNARLEVLSNEKACSLEQYESGDCPIRIGRATANTPVLSQPLTGDVHLVRSPARRLPDVMVALKGQAEAAALSIDLTGKVKITRDLRLRTIFDTVPDAPITRFQLKFEPGRNSALGLTKNICVRRNRRATDAVLRFVGQNNRRVGRKQQMRVAGCKQARRRAKARRRARLAARRAAASDRGSARAVATRRR